MKKLLPFVRRYGLLIFPLIVIALEIEGQIFIYQRFNEFHNPDSWVIHLFYLSFGPFIFFNRFEKMRFRHPFSVWKRVYWALFIGLATFYVLAFIAAALL